MNLCSDQLLLMLADPHQVISVSHLSREETSSFVADRASAFPINHARLEEIISFQPDLVLTVPHTNPRLLNTLKHLDYEIYPMTLGTRLEDISSEIRRLAKRLGQESRGEQLIGEMLRQIKPATQSQDINAPPGALFYQPRGYTSGANTLQNEALNLAGWRNLAAEQGGIVGYSQVSLEQVILWQPDTLFSSPYGKNSDSLAQRKLRHPVLTRLLNHRPRREIPYKYWICPGPMLAEAVSLLRDAKRGIK
jgi:iron complex transport system substrate-binding protein